jgi:molybdopterin adenylyltransferase
MISPAASHKSQFFEPTSMGYREHHASAESLIARCAIVTLSDTRTVETDQSGATIKRLVESAGHLVTHYQIIPDDPRELETLLEMLLGITDVDAILTSGGTGISRRDQTIAAVERLIDLPLSGFGELFRMLSWSEIGSSAMLSRALGGVSRGKLIFAMPGSTPAVELAMTKLILPEIQHLVHELRK